MLKRFRKRLKKQKEGMVYVYTFKDGTTLWTYPESKLQFVAIAHEQQVSQYRNFLLLLNKNKHEARVLADKTIALLRGILSGGDVAQLATQAITLLEYNLTLPLNISDAESKLIEALFCMYYITDEENPYTYNEFENEKKIRLINEVPEKRAEFFFALQKSARHLINTFKELDQIYSEGIEQELHRLVLLNTKNNKTEIT